MIFPLKSYETFSLQDIREELDKCFIDIFSNLISNHYTKFKYNFFYFFFLRNKSCMSREQNMWKGTEEDKWISSY